MNCAPSEDLHNSLLASQALAFFEEINKKASHDPIRECYDDFEVCQAWTEVSEDFQSKFQCDPFLHPTYHHFYLACFEPFLKPFVFYSNLSKFRIVGLKVFIRFILT